MIATFTAPLVNGAVRARLTEETYAPADPNDPRASSSVHLTWIEEGPDGKPRQTLDDWLTGPDLDAAWTTGIASGPDPRAFTTIVNARYPGATVTP